MASKLRAVMVFEDHDQKQFTAAMNFNAEAFMQKYIDERCKDGYKLIHVDAAPMFEFDWKRFFELDPEWIHNTDWQRAEVRATEYGSAMKGAIIARKLNIARNIYNLMKSRV